MSKLTELQAIAVTVTNETVIGANDEARIGGGFSKVVEAITEEGGLKVDKVAGYGLSENNYSDLDAQKLLYVETPYYTENSSLSGSFTLHRNEILSFVNALTGVLTIALEVPIDGRPNMYHLCANMGATAQTLTLSCAGYTITWAGGSAPTPTVSKPFEISFVKTAPTIINAIFKQL